MASCLGRITAWFLKRRLRNFTSENEPYCVMVLRQESFHIPSEQKMLLRCQHEIVSVFREALWIHPVILRNLKGPCCTEYTKDAKVDLFLPYSPQLKNKRES